MAGKYNYFIGLDPSFSGLGLSIINEDKKEITFKELEVDVGHRSIYRNSRCKSHYGK